MHAHDLNKVGETTQRLLAVGAWRDAPYFTDAERAALELAEAVTRLSDRPDPVPDDLWERAARHYDEKQLAGLLFAISLVNVWNRINVSTRQVAGEWAKSAEAREWVEKAKAREQSVAV
jgi:alkylhydroperoxidase family enzyme